MAISQIELCENIVALLEEFGYKTMNMRQMNAVIQASTIIIAELSNPTSEAKPGMGFIAWQSCDDTGASSKYLASLLYGVRPRSISYPHDSDDFGRCYRMLRAVEKDWNDMQHVVSEKDGMPWIMLSLNWPDLELLYEANKHKELSVRIKELIYGK